ncbi:2-phosphosulfolactate phosphatase [Stratiformator vulcanicus]|uniref:Probable 2-phosphosulfolactate phosphatase n=1 Tax=Stratiformator vulcanicus TaxID=2527980 RepID=A0A517R2B7_9PLAN|nr:2-phosphosulfolactate phosphatase [Stratiformator vulcanicus]QDT37993.1 putative 2-phosphosulfolactate phosphatase [Stratiformator vulcanicus]
MSEPLEVSVHLLPKLVEPKDLRGRTVIMIDVLRASTTICTALRNGAERVIACGSIEEAQQRAASLSPRPLLGGERGGVKIDGFDLGNSPLEYVREAVEGRTILFTTTNGTAALLHAKEASAILIGGCVNAKAVAVAAKSLGKPIAILCAGTNGHVTMEDTLAAGLLVAELAQTPEEELANDEAMMVLGLYVWVGKVNKEFAGSIEMSYGGRNLHAIGREEDIPIAAEIDSVPVVPRFDPNTSEIRVVE